MDSYTVWVFFLSILNDVSHAIRYARYLLFAHFSYFIITTKQKKVCYYMLELSVLLLNYCYYLNKKSKQKNIFTFLTSINGK